MNHQIYQIHNEEVILNEISKLQPLNYNQFRWWRKFDTKTKPLPNKSPLLSKIKNGDFEFSHFYWQAKYSEIELNQKHYESLDGQHFTESTRMDRARRKRLWEDFEKDEVKKLETLKKEFTKEFFIEPDEYNNESETFDGTLEEFYKYCSEKYGKNLYRKSGRGRPRKN